MEPLQPLKKVGKLGTPHIFSKSSFDEVNLASYMTVKPWFCHPFPFLSLPRELQLKILSYTDLVTPLSSVKWDPYDKYHLGIEHVQNCYPRNEAGCGPPYDQCHPDNHVKCPGHLRPADDVPKARQRSQYCLCPHACEALAERGMASCRSCTHYACQFLPLRKDDDASRRQCSPKFDNYSIGPRAVVYWTPPSSLFLVSRAFRNVSSAVFFGCNHFKISCNNWKASRNKIDWDNDLVKYRVNCKARLPSLPSRAGPSIFLRDVLSRDAWQLLSSLEIDLSGIANYSNMQEWLSIAQEIGPQLRLKTLLLHGESPVDGLQDVAEWRGQHAADSFRLAREEVAMWMWPPLKGGAAAIARSGGTSGRLELFTAKIYCASGGPHDTVQYSILGPGQLNVDRSVPQGCFDMSRGEESTMLDWCYHVSIDMEMSLPTANTSLVGGLEALRRVRWVEDVLVSCREPDFGLERQDSRD